MFYEREFNVSYPLPKQGKNKKHNVHMYMYMQIKGTLCIVKKDHLTLSVDLFAIPDFSAGAMENWGLITYRETALLYDEDTDPATSKQRVAVVIAHELAHQVRKHLSLSVVGTLLLQWFSGWLRDYILQS